MCRLRGAVLRAVVTEPHASARARERYGLELKERDLREIAATARKDGLLQARQSNGCEVWITKVHGVVCRVVLAKNGTVLTFLPARARLNKEKCR